jgi:hypothetical protein
MTRFAIIDPIDGDPLQPQSSTSADTSVTVTVHALDQYGNIATGENRDVNLLADKSSVFVSGSNRVNIVAGVGTIEITDRVAESVNLALQDAFSTGVDCSSVQSVLFVPGT